MKIINKIFYLPLLFAYLVPANVFAADDLCAKYKTCKEKLACTIAVNLFGKNKPTEWETLVAQTLAQNPECETYKHPEKNVDLTFNNFNPAVNLKIDWALVGQYRSAYLNSPQYGRYGIAFIESDGALGVGVVAGASAAAIVGAFYAIPAGLTALGVGTLGAGGTVATTGTVAGAAGATITTTGGITGAVLAGEAIPVGATIVSGGAILPAATATGLGATTVGGHLAGVVGGAGTVATIGGGTTLAAAGAGGGTVAAAGMANGLNRYDQMDEVIKNSRTWSDYTGCFNECNTSGYTTDKTDLLTRYVLQPLFNNMNSYCVNNNEGKLNLLYTNGNPLIVTEARGKEILSTISSKIADNGKCDYHVFDMDAYLVQFLYDENGNMLPKYIIVSEPTHIDD